MTTIPAPIPDVEHSILVDIGLAAAVRVPIDGLDCPGCGVPLHLCQSPTGVLTDHTVRAWARHCDWTEDRFTQWAHREALARQAATSSPSWALS